MKVVCFRPSCLRVRHHWKTNHNSSIDTVEDNAYHNATLIHSSHFCSGCDEQAGNAHIMSHMLCISSQLWFSIQSVELSTHHFLGMYRSTFDPASFCMLTRYSGRLQSTGKGGWEGGSDGTTETIDPSSTKGLISLSHTRIHLVPE